MESTKEQEKSYYTLVFDEIGQDLKGTVALIQDALCCDKNSVIEMLAMLPGIVAGGLVLQDAELLQRKLAELGNKSSICKDTEIVSLEEKEPVSTPTEIFMEKPLVGVRNKRIPSILIRCRICRQMAECSSLAIFISKSCPNCGATQLLTYSEYKTRQRIKDNNESDIKRKLEGKSVGPKVPNIKKFYDYRDAEKNILTSMEESENEL